MDNTPQTLTEQLYQKNLDLLYERKRMEGLLYSVSEAVISVSKDFKITLFNHAAELLTNKKAQDALGKDISEIITIYNKDNTMFDIKNNCFTGSSQDVLDLYLNNIDKKHFLIFKSETVAVETGPEECLITLTDITREKQLEQAKDDFISVASHELRTPMTIIKSYLWMLTAGKGGPLNTKQMEYLYKSTNATQRMIDLINDTLNISRLEQGRVEYDIKKIDLSEAIEELYNDLSVKTTERNIYLNFHKKDPIYVYADRSKVGEVITNLVGNATKFTKKGGIDIYIDDTPDFAKVFIKDTGAGINSLDLKNLFLKFSRLDNSYQTVAETGGTGLGLYIVKLYVEGMGGTVGAESDGIRKGSTFWFTLPKNDLQITTIAPVKTIGDLTTTTIS